jgi:general secretion pathway protein E
MPSVHGEDAVIRILDKESLSKQFASLRLDVLGFDEKELSRFRRFIREPYGMVLVTGPTGSGKTTTLYAALSEINTPDKNIITIEDPVEIQLGGIGQIEVKPSIGLSFAAGLRSVLRQNPDVILVGEIRDLETAEIAIQASLTGHLVLSTLHTNDSAGAITRLIDQGVEPFLIGSSLVACLAQRLVRVLCTHCREAYEPTREELAELGLAPADLKGRPIYRARGCASCNNSGYRGQCAIFEILVVDDAVRRHITRGIDSKTIQDAATARGMTTLRMDGRSKVLDGTTSIAEVLRQTDEAAVASLEPQQAPAKPQK